MGSRTYTDSQLVAAVAESRSWRGVLRHLGLQATSASAMRSVRRNAERLDLSHAHFTGQRRWTEQELADAVRGSRSWTEVATGLGLSGGSSTSALRGHAVRLGLATDHLTRRHPMPAEPQVMPDLAYLRRAGSMIAAAWFTLRGYEVAWPLEPCPHDLVVSRADGSHERVQVKTTTRNRDGSWLVRITRTTGTATPYGPEDIDSFFIIDGDLNCFRIPYAAVGGLLALRLAAYESFRVGSAHSLIEGFT